MLDCLKQLVSFLLVGSVLLGYLFMFVQNSLSFFFLLQFYFF